MPDQPSDADWHDDAACGRHENPDLWFSYDDVDRAEALRICSGCPVLTHCLADALRRDERYGIWGGRTQDQLRTIRRDLRDRGRRSA